MRINEFVPDSKIFNGTLNKTNQTDNQSTDFLSTLNGKLDELNTQQINSENLSEQFIKGEDVDIHKVTIAAEEAKMSLELAVQVRNKLVDAYQELNRMQL